jgi:hypothetical protein
VIANEITEVALVPAHEVEQQLRRRAVALVGHLLQRSRRSSVLEVERVRVEHRVPAQAEGLVDLEVEDMGPDPRARDVPRRAHVLGSHCGQYHPADNRSGAEIPKD